MRFLLAWIGGLRVVWAAIPTVDFTMNVSPPPEPRTRFKITWAPPVSGDINLLLHNLDPSAANSNASAGSTILEIKDSQRFASFWWLVPSNLCGRHSFSLQGQFEGNQVTRVDSQVWDNGPCGVSSAPATQTSTCIPQRTPVSSKPNTFLIPNDDRYPYRIGQKSLVAWVASGEGTVDLLFKREGSDETVPLAENIPNTGSYEWVPDSTLANYPMPRVVTPGMPLRFVIKASTNTVSTPSAFFYVLRESDPMVFMNVSTWSYPTIGQATTFLWSPSNESFISLRLSFGNRQPLDTITIADGVPNTGSWEWNLPSDFNPGSYLLQGLSDNDPYTGYHDTGFYPIVVGREAAVECEASATGQATASQTAAGANTSAEEGKKESEGTGLGSTSWVGIGGIIVLGLLGVLLVL